MGTDAKLNLTYTRKKLAQMSSTATLDRGLELLMAKSTSIHDDPQYQAMIAEKERLLVPKMMIEHWLIVRTLVGLLLFFICDCVWNFVFCLLLPPHPTPRILHGKPPRL